MLILSIIPLHLSIDSDGIAANYLSQVDVTEHRIMELEAAFSSAMLNQYLGVEVTGVNTYDLEAIKQQLDAASQQELNLIQDTWNISDNDSKARLESILRTLSAVTQRLNDLYSLQAGTNTYVISGVDNTDSNAIQKEIDMALSYRAFLEEREQFWREIVGDEEMQQDLQGISGFWDTIVSSNMQAQTLSTAYSFTNEIISTGDDAIILSSTAKLLNDTINKFHELVENQTNERIAKANEVLQMFGSISQAFSTSWNPGDISSQISTLEAFLSTNGSFLEELGLQAPLVSIISDWKILLDSQNRTNQLVSDGNQTISGDLSSGSSYLDTTIANLTQSRDATINNLTLKEQSITNEQTVTDNLYNTSVSAGNAIDQIVTDEISTQINNISTSINTWAGTVNDPLLKGEMDSVIVMWNEMLEAHRTNGTPIDFQKITNEINRITALLNEKQNSIQNEKDKTTAEIKATEDKYTNQSNQTQSLSDTIDLIIKLIGEGASIEEITAQVGNFDELINTWSQSVNDPALKDSLKSVVGLWNQMLEQHAANPDEPIDTQSFATALNEQRELLNQKQTGIQSEKDEAVNALRLKEQRLANELLATQELTNLFSSIPDLINQDISDDIANALSSLNGSIAPWDGSLADLGRIFNDIKNNSSALKAKSLALQKEKEETIALRLKGEAEYNREIAATQALKTMFDNGANYFANDANNYSVSENQAYFADIDSYAGYWAQVINDAQITGNITVTVNSVKNIFQGQQNAINTLNANKEAFNTSLQNTTSYVNATYQNMVTTRDSTIASGTWNMFIGTKDDPLFANFWRQVFYSTRSSQDLEDASGDWNTTMSPSTAINTLGTASDQYGQFVLFLQQNGGTLSPEEAGRLLINSYSFLNPLQNASGTWQTNALNLIAPNAQGEMITENPNLNLQDKYDPDELSKMAKTKRQANKTLLSIRQLAQSNSVDLINSKLEELQAKLHDAIRRAQTLGLNPNSLRSISDIKSEISRLTGEKGLVETQSVAQDDLGDSFDADLATLDDLGMSAVLYSG